MKNDFINTQLPRKDERDKFDLIFHEFYPRLLAYGELFIDRQSVEDILQDLMVSLWENAENIVIHTSLESYLFKSVYQKCLNKIKYYKVREEYKNKQVIFADNFELKYYDPEENETIRKIFSDELSLEIENAIAELPLKCREVFKSGYIKNLRTKEIALEFNISERTVEAHIYTALKQLRNKLRDKFYLLPLFFLFK